MDEWLIAKIVEAVFAVVGLVTSVAFARFHVREFAKGMREGACERTGHAMRPWLRRCKACGYEEEIDKVDE